MRLLFLTLLFASLVLATKKQSALFNASLLLQDAFADFIPPSTPPANIIQSTPRLVIYVQTFSDTAGKPLSLLPLLEYNTKVTHVILGSVHLHEEPGKIMLNNDPFDSEIYDLIWKEVKILQQNGVKVMALLGGAAAGTYPRLRGDEEKFQSYYKPLLSLIKKHNLDGLDIDIEEAVPLFVPLRLIRTLSSDLGSSFLLSMAPMAVALSEDDTALSGFSYMKLDSLAISNPEDKNSTKLIDWYNVQCYSGYARTTWMYKSIVEKGFAAERVVLGVTTSVAGYENGFTRIKKLLETIKGLKEAYGEKFGGVAGWEYWDAGSDDGDMGMQVGGEPWRWVNRVAKGVFGEEERRRGKKWSGDCWRRCMRGDS